MRPRHLTLAAAALLLLLGAPLACDRSDAAAPRPTAPETAPAAAQTAPQVEVPATTPPEPSPLTDETCRAIFDAPIYDLVRLDPEVAFDPEIHASALMQTQCNLHLSRSEEDGAVTMKTLVLYRHDLDGSPAATFQKLTQDQAPTPPTASQVEAMQKTLRMASAIERSAAKDDKKRAEITQRTDAQLADFKATQTRTTFTPLPQLGAHVKLATVSETLRDTSTETHEVYFLEGGQVFSLSATKPTPKDTLIQVTALLLPNVRAALN